MDEALDDFGEISEMTLWIFVTYKTFGMILISKVFKMDILKTFLALDHPLQLDVRIHRPNIYIHLHRLCGCYNLLICTIYVFMDACVKIDTISNLWACSFGQQLTKYPS
jgi:hypothetical protein